MDRHEGIMRLKLNHIKDRLDEVPNISDTRGIKQGLLDYIIEAKIDLNTLKPSKELMQNMIGYIMVVEPNWIMADLPEINTARKFYKGWYNIISNQLAHKDFLRAKLEEHRADKQYVLDEQFRYLDEELPEKQGVPDAVPDNEGPRVRIDAPSPPPVREEEHQPSSFAEPEEE